MPHLGSHATQLPLLLNSPLGQLDVHCPPFRLKPEMQVSQLGEVHDAQYCGHSANTERTIDQHARHRHSSQHENERVRKQSEGLCPAPFCV